VIICDHAGLFAEEVLLGLTIINSSWLPALAKDTLCSFSKPIQNSLGVPMAIPKFGPEGWELPAIKAV